MKLDPQCEAAVNLAKQSVPDGDQLDVRLLMAALCHATDLKDKIPNVAGVLRAPRPVRRTSEQVPLAPPVAEIFQKLEPRETPVTPGVMFVECARTEPGTDVLKRTGLDDSAVKDLLASLEGKEPGSMTDERLESLRDEIARIWKRVSASDIPQEAEILDCLRRIATRLDFDPARRQVRDTIGVVGSWFGLLAIEHDLHNLGNEFYKMNWFDEAIECYNAALKIRPNLLETYFNRALAYTRQRLYDRAMADIDKVIEMDDRLAEVWYTRGLVFEYQLKYQEAIQQYEKARDLGGGYEQKARDQIEGVRNKIRASAHGDDQDEARRQERLQEAENVIRFLSASRNLMHLDETFRWRQSAERAQVVQYLTRFGYLLTDPSAKPRNLIGNDTVIRALVRALCKMKRKSVILLGQAGTGKTATVEELAYRMFHGHPSIPRRLQDYDVLSLSSVALQANSKYAGEYAEKIDSLIQMLRKYPRIILFVDEIHSFFQSSIEGDSDVFTRGNQSLKKALSDGEINFIGTTTPSEYRFFIEPDKALARRFSRVLLDPPARTETLRILEGRKAAMEQYYENVRIPDPMLVKAIELTDDYVLGRYQPDKSIQLLDDACSYCFTAQPPLQEVTEAILTRVLEDIVGRPVLAVQGLTVKELARRLQEKVKGQDDVIDELSRAVIAGLGAWTKRTEPRGVFLFAGPTGVGKTETAMQLAVILGGGRDALIRIDCNTLQGSGDSGEMCVSRLLGVPPGFGGHLRGQGGMLSRVRDLPESIVLFDEFEKADPAVGKLLLQIIDDGRVEDVDGNVLDFRRSFIIFTTNAGSVYDQRRVGLSRPGAAEGHKPSVDLEGLTAALRRVGMTEEFMGRINHVFLFQGLEPASTIEILRSRLESLRQTVELKNRELTWSRDVIPYLTHVWQPRYGVRHLDTILRNRIAEHLNIADAQGDFAGVAKIRLTVAKQWKRSSGGPFAGVTTCRRVRDTLVVVLGEQLAPQRKSRPASAKAKKPPKR